MVTCSQPDSRLPGVTRNRSQTQGRHIETTCTLFSAFPSFNCQTRREETTTRVICYNINPGPMLDACTEWKIATCVQREEREERGRRVGGLGWDAMGAKNNGWDFTCCRTKVQSFSPSDREKRWPLLVVRLLKTLSVSLRFCEGRWIGGLVHDSGVTVTRIPNKSTLKSQRKHTDTF